MRRALAPLLATLLFLAGCAAKEGLKDKKKGEPSGRAGEAGKAKDPGEGRGDGQEAAPGKVVPRKIRYTADLTVIVKDLAEAEQALRELLSQAKGYVARSDIRGTTGQPRYGEWTLRVPVEQLQSFRDAVVKLGEPTRNRVDSEDVTDEFYDLQARIKNMEAEEEGIRKLYEKTTGKMEDLLAVRRELTSLRDKIDRAQGRLKLLANLTDLTTVNVTLSERDAYVPEEAASFGTVAGRTLRTSASALVQVGRGLALFAVALVPWLPVLGVVVLLGWALARRRWGRRAAEAAVSAPPRAGTAPPP